jgi:hypothetical protein
MITSGGLEGRIDVRLSRRDGRVAAVEIRSSRPQVAQRLMAGRTAAEAADLAGRVFTLCGQAQRHAAEAACEAAAGARPAAARVAERAARVRAELAREHAWRLLLDWPRQAGVAPDTEALLALRQAADEPAQLAGILEGLLEGRLLGEPAAAWLARDLAGFDAWRRAGATATARLFGGLDAGPDPSAGHGTLLPPLAGLDADDLAGLGRRALAEPAFCARPEWQGSPAETGAIARQAAAPLLAEWIAGRGRGAGARLLARLLELAALPGRLRDGAAGPAMLGALALDAHTGLAAVETSRGLLLHVARLEAGRVADYRIVAPTEWNFHPAGPLAEALRGLPAGGDLDARARQVALSLDPCVEYGVEIADA